MTITSCKYIDLGILGGREDMWTVSTSLIIIYVGKISAKKKIVKTGIKFLWHYHSEETTKVFNI